MVTVHDGFSWVAPRVSRERFIREFQGTPAEPDASAAYDAFNFWHVDPLLGLAIWTRESDRSRNPESVNARYGNRNPGNIRNPPPKGETIETDRGPFLTFHTWEAGFGAMAEHLDSPLYRGLTIWDAIHKWAPAEDGNDPDDYAAGVVAYMNATGDMLDAPGGATVAKRVILSAGHVNITAITDERLAPGDAGRLRGASGALGTEAIPNQAVVDEAADLLRRAGVKVVRADATYDPSIYGNRADLCIFVHHDGNNQPNSSPQYSGAAVVQSGNRDNGDVAQKFVDAWNRLSPGITGISDLRLSENPTDGMTGYYGGWYPTQDTPAALVECGVWGGADGQRLDVDTGREGHAVAAAIAAALGVGDVPGAGTGDSEPGSGDSGGGGGSPPVETDPVTAGWGTQADGSMGRVFEIPGSGGRRFFVGHGFADYYRTNGYPDGDDAGISPLFGYPLTGEFVYPTPTESVVIQVFERAVFEFRDGVVSLRRLGAMFLNSLPRPGVAPDDAWYGG